MNLCTKYLVEYNDEEVSVGATEDRDVHGDGCRVRLVESHAEVPLPAEQEEDEDPWPDETVSQSVIITTSLTYVHQAGF